MNVTDLMDRNVGDEDHRDENWTECPSCGYDNPADYGDCTFCGATL